MLRRKTWLRSLHIKTEVAPSNAKASIHADNALRPRVNVAAAAKVNQPLIRKNSFLWNQARRVDSAKASVFTKEAGIDAVANAGTVHVTRTPKSDGAIIFLGSLTVISGLVFWWTNRELVFLDKFGRVRLMTISWETERELAEGLRQDLAVVGDAEFGPELPMNDYRRVELERIASEIIESTETDFFQVRGKLNWDIYVRENPEENAHCQIGGTVTVYTGLFDRLVSAEANNEIPDARCALACILAHEIAHGYCRHAIEKLGWMPVDWFVTYIVQDSYIMKTILSLFFALPFSRTCEMEADAVGLELMARAGYDPRQAMIVYQVISDLPQFIEFASTHPSGGHRAARVEALLPQVIQLYEVRKNRFKKKDAPKPLLRWWLLSKPSQPSLDSLPLSEVRRRLEPMRFKDAETNLNNVKVSKSNAVGNRGGLVERSLKARGMTDTLASNVRIKLVEDDTMT